MKASIIINGKEHKRDIPVCWDQVTFETFMKLDECGNDIVKVIALVTRIDYQVLAKAHIKNMDQVIAALGFLKKPVAGIIPKTILGYPVPKNLEFEQIQLYIDLKNYLPESH